MNQWLIAALVSAGLATSGAASAATVADFLSQHVKLDLTQSPTEIKVEAVAQVKITQDTQTLKVAALSPGIVSVTWDGVPVTTVNAGGAAVISFPSKLTAGTEGTLRVELSGVPACAYAGYEVCLRSQDLTYLIPPWYTGTWYLSNAQEIDAQACTLELRIPSGHKAAALGVPPVVVDGGDGTSTWTFESAAPVTDMAFVAGAYGEIQGIGDGFPTRGLYTGAASNAQVLQPAIDEGGKLAKLFGGWWGQPPVKEFQYGIISGNTPFAGTEIGGLMLLQDMLLTPAYAYILADANHELAHYWWGSMSWASDDNQFGFFAESLAEYSLWRGLGELNGQPARDTGTRMNAVWYMYRRPSDDDTPVFSLNSYDIAVFAIYHKGSTVVRTLEQAAGVQAIDTALSDLIEAGPGAATIDGFQASILAASGVDIAPYVSTWLLGIGFPVVTVSATVAQSAGGYKVTLAATGQDFPMLIPVYALMPDGTRTPASIAFSGGHGEAALELTQRPLAVEVDPGWTAVRELKPAVPGDVSFDGQVDGADLIEVALRIGGKLPTIRRKDGKYDPLYDLDVDRAIQDKDLDEVVKQAAP
jgi:aminopeptidase N